MREKIEQLAKIEYMISQIETKIKVQKEYFGKDSGMFFDKQYHEGKLMFFQAVKLRLRNYLKSKTNQLFNSI